MAKEWALGAGIVFAVTTLIRTAGVDKWWRPYVPGGIAVAVGTFIYLCTRADRLTNFIQEYIMYHHLPLLER